MLSGVDRLLVLLLFAALLAGCGASGSRYSISRDRAPAGGVDPASVPLVVPRPVVRTAAGNRSPYTVFGQTYSVMSTEEGYLARGVASWYGEKFHGHRTANGEIYDMYKASAAHTSLPIPSFLRVTNLENNRSLVVRVNDRGPFHGGRIVDLSYAAAVKLGFADQGTARVQLEAIVPGAGEEGAPAPNPPVLAAASPAGAELYLQVGAFAARNSAESVTRRVRAHTSRPVFIASAASGERGLLHRVRIGPIQGVEEARDLTRTLVAAGLGTPYTVAE